MRAPVARTASLLVFLLASGSPDMALAQSSGAAPVPAAPDPSSASTAAAPSSGRMEFDERLIRGERAAGSIYLFQRSPRELPGLVPLRVSYRARIVEPVLGLPMDDASVEHAGLTPAREGDR